MKPVYLMLFLISAAMLAFQVALTRFFSLAQGHHFAFMAISLALLGAGASGTYLSLRPPKPAAWRRTITGGALLFTVSLPAAYLAINYLPFDAYRIAWEPIQLLWLVLYYLSLTVPFFFGGLIIGVALSMQTEQAGSVYAANLLGSGLGPPLALLALTTLGGPGTVFACTLLGWIAVIGHQRPVIRHQNRWHLTLYALVTLGLVYLAIFPPAIFDVQLTPYKSLSQAKLYPGSEIIFSDWNAFSRVDVLESEGIRSAPGLSFTYPGRLPPQLGLFTDGDNLSPITQPAHLEFARFLPLSLAFALRSEANTLILEPGGGLAVLVALEHSAQTITVVQSNHTSVEAIQDYFADFSGHLYNSPRVTVVIDEPRSFLRRTGQAFDLIILPLTDSFRPVTAGAYTLSEDYRYTVEAFSDMLRHLSPDGLLVVERWLQLPPSESLRLWGTMIAALRRLDEGRDIDPAQHLLALRSLQTSLVIASRGPLSTQEMTLTRRFAEERQFDLIWLPGIQPDEANQYSIVPDAAYYRSFADLLQAANPDTFYEDYPYAVAPPTDDHPYFFHFFRWQQTPEILNALGRSWQPFGGSGYLVLVVLLGLVVLLSAGLILLPLLWMRRTPLATADVNESPSSSSTPGEPQPHPSIRGRYWGCRSLPILNPSAKAKLRFLLYFALLGLGFLFVEIPLLQRFILYLGQPAYAFAVTVPALLAAAGIGSGYLSPRLSLRVVLPLVTLVIVLYPFLLPLLFQSTLEFPFAGRIVIAVLALFPVGMLLGVPFPSGIRLVGQTAPNLVAWVWAVNGCASVISAVLAAMIALTWGFSAVLWSAALAYGLAGLVIWRLLPGSEVFVKRKT